jgi:hypothetical protein
MRADPRLPPPIEYKRRIRIGRRRDAWAPGAGRLIETILPAAGDLARGLGELKLPPRSRAFSAL